MVPGTESQNTSKLFIILAECKGGRYDTPNHTPASSPLGPSIHRTGANRPFDRRRHSPSRSHSVVGMLMKCRERWEIGNMPYKAMI